MKRIALAICMLLVGIGTGDAEGGRRAKRPAPVKRVKQKPRIERPPVAERRVNKVFKKELIRDRDANPPSPPVVLPEKTAVSWRRPARGWVFADRHGIEVSHAELLDAIARKDPKLLAKQARRRIGSVR